MKALQGFKAVELVVPTGKSTMTITDSVIRFNKATAVELGHPAYVRVLVNEKEQQIALQACTAKDANAIKFSKGDGKQTGSVSIKTPAVLEAVAKFFTLSNPSEDEIDQRVINGVNLPDSKAIVFNVSDAEASIAKRRGRRKVSE